MSRPGEFQFALDRKFHRVVGAAEQVHRLAKREEGGGAAPEPEGEPSAEDHRTPKWPRWWACPPLKPAVCGLTGLGRRHAPSQYRDQERDNVNQAVAALHRVGLAQGILMTRRQLRADQAFALLKRESQNTHVKLRTIAQTVIQTGDLPVGR